MTGTPVMNDEMTAGALADIRVVDLSENLAGPYCAQILGDLGAEVTKVERPGGDPARAWGPPFAGDDAALFVCTNRHKHTIELDLRVDRAKAELWQLLERADVIIQSFRPGAIERLGFGEADVRAKNERAIYCSVSAWGRQGPLRQAAGYDPLLQAFSGLMSVTGEAEGPPVRVGTSLVDMGAGMWLAIGVLAALRERDRTGKGRRVEVSLLGAALSWMGYHLIGAQTTGRSPGRHGTAFPSIAPYEAFETADGRLMIAVGNDSLFLALCDVLARTDLATDPRYATNALRVAARAELRREVEDATRGWKTAALTAALEEAGVPCAPILDVAEALAHPQTEASGLLVELPEAEPSGLRVVAMPVAFDGRAPDVGRGVPKRVRADP